MTPEEIALWTEAIESVTQPRVGRTANLNGVRPIVTASPSLSVWRVMRRLFTSTPLVLLRSSTIV